MRAVLLSVAVLFLCSPMPAQQRQPAPVPRTFVPNEPLPCVAFNSMAARLDAVYYVEEISKSDYDEGMKRYRNGTQIDGVDYFKSDKDKYQRMTLQLDKRADFIRWYAVEGGRAQLAAANAQCNTELGERETTYAQVDALRQLQDTLTVAQAEGLLADAALEGQNVVIKALLQSETEQRKLVGRYNKLIENVNTYNKAVNDLVVTVNDAMDEPKGSKIAPKLSFNFIRLPSIACTESAVAFTNATTYMANVRAMAIASSTMHCE